MTQLREYIFIILAAILFIALSHIAFMSDVQTGKAVDNNGNMITTQDVTWFCDKF